VSEVGGVFGAGLTAWPRPAVMPSSTGRCSAQMLEGYWQTGVVERPSARSSASEGVVECLSARSSASVSRVAMGETAQACCLSR